MILLHVVVEVKTGLTKVRKQHDLLRESVYGCDHADPGLIDRPTLQPEGTSSCLFLHGGSF
jgi:hypothetical protein